MFLEWDTDDQDKALAYMRDRNVRCPGCGTDPADWEHDKDAFISDHYVCPGCQRLEEERGNVSDGMKGVHYRLLPRVVALAKIEQEEQRRRERKHGNE